jgi:hypothetical protein
VPANDTPSPGHRSNTETIHLEIEGLIRLAAARDAIEATLEGHWVTTPAYFTAVAELLAAAAARFRWAQSVAT